MAMKTNQTGEYVSGLYRIIGSISDTEYVSLRADASTNTIQTIEYEHHEIHSGSAYRVIYHVDVPADDVLDVRFVTANSTKWVHMVNGFETQGEFHVTCYRGIGITVAGTDLTIFNKNHNSSKTSGMTAFDYIVNTNLTTANDDTDITSAVVTGLIQSGSGRGTGGGAEHENEEILKQNTGYCLRFENESSAARYVNFEFEWYEHTAKN